MKFKNIFGTIVVIVLGNGASLWIFASEFNGQSTAFDYAITAAICIIAGVISRIISPRDATEIATSGSLVAGMFGCLTPLMLVGALASSKPLSINIFAPLLFALAIFSLIFLGASIARLALPKPPSS